MASRQRNLVVGPEVFVLGGPNGAGKSSAARVLLPESLHVLQFVNGDLIAEGLSPFAPQSAALEAGRVMLERIHRLMDRRASFGFETTLAARSYAPLLHVARKTGYVVHMIYVWLNSADLAASRVADRVKQGGHDVHPDVIRRRYWRSAANLFDLYLPLANTWTLCDNSGRELVTVACGGEGQAITVFDPQAYELIRQAAAHGRT